MEVKLNSDWEKVIRTELAKPYFKELSKVIDNKVAAGTVYPSSENFFRAFNLCSFEQLSVVILGQDPYHGEGQATGLAFSVQIDTKLPPSLRNIYKELKGELGTARSCGSLEDWAKQGVLLLNSTLTVEAGQPGSHQNLGWETFTDSVIKTISKEKMNVVFLLWGKYAAAKQDLIDNSKHLVLIAPHPSPFSAHTGFFGCRHFSQTNEYLTEHGRPIINW